MENNTDKVKNFGEFINENNEIVENKSESFKKELKELLTKYNADIYAQMDGDTHGVEVEIIIDIDNKEVIRNYDSISQYDIK